MPIKDDAIVLVFNITSIMESNWVLSQAQYVQKLQIKAKNRDLDTFLLHERHFLHYFKSRPEDYQIATDRKLAMYMYENNLLLKDYERLPLLALKYYKTYVRTQTADDYCVSKDKLLMFYFKNAEGVELLFDGNFKEYFLNGNSMLTLALYLGTPMTHLTRQVKQELSRVHDDIQNVRMGDNNFMRVLVALELMNMDRLYVVLSSYNIDVPEVFQVAEITKLLVPMTAVLRGMKICIRCPQCYNPTPEYAVRMYCEATLAVKWNDLRIAIFCQRCAAFLLTIGRE